MKQYLKGGNHFEGKPSPVKKVGENFFGMFAEWIQLVSSVAQTKHETLVQAEMEVTIVNH